MSTSLWMKVILRCSFVIRKAGLIRMLVVVPAGTPTLDISGTELRKRLRTGAVRLELIGLHSASLILTLILSFSQPIPDWFSYE